MPVNLGAWLRQRLKLGAVHYRRALRSIRQYGELPAKLCDYIDEGVCVVDRQHCVVYWNEAYARRRGIEADIMYAGMPLSILQAKACRFRVMRPGAAAIFGRESLVEILGWQEATLKIEQENGIILRVSGRQVDNDHYAIMYIDITESERAALAYRDATARLTATLDNVLDGIITIDDHGTIDSFSAGAEQLLGYRAAEVIGKNVKLLMPAGLAASHDGYLAKYRASRVPHIMRKPREVEARHKDGRQVPIELGVSEMTIGKTLRFIGVLRDITERRRVERMQHEFVATASHELRTPLTSIIGSLGLLRGGSAGQLPQPAQKLIDIAYRNGERLGRLVNDILESEKAESGQFKLSIEVLSLRALAAESVDANQSYAQRFGVGLALVASGADASCVVDRARLHQVLTNLISNAVKFSPRGSHVQVAVRHEDSSAVVAVTDHGPGIPQDFRAHLFERFTQADSSDARHGGGTGLGLSIARSLAEQMGGNIEVDSVEGEGSTFRVRLPLATAAASAA
jgi:PAS domain S-box-containing protein